MALSYRLEIESSLKTSHLDQVLIFHNSIKKSYLSGRRSFSLEVRPLIRLEADDGFRLQSLGSFLDFELDSLPFVEGFIALGLDSAVVNEDVLTALTLDEPVTLAGVKPLDGTLFSGQLRNSLLESYLRSSSPLESV